MISNQYIKYENYSCNTMTESLYICSISMHLHILHISILKDNSFLKYAKQIFAFLCLFSNDKTSHSLYIKKLMTDSIESSRNRLSSPKICLKLIRAPISFSITSHKGFTYLHSNNKCSILRRHFDSIEWNFLIKSLQFFNFGPSFIKWVETIYNKPVAYIKNNGHISETFQLSRGIRQGCPVSALLFIICTELLADKIRCNKDLLGFKFWLSTKPT